MTEKACKDCKAEGITNKRVMATDRNGNLRPGPRCVTHWRIYNRQQKDKAHGNRLRNNFGLTSEEYWLIYEYQGGRCYVCGWAQGKSRRLCVDHDHRKAEDVCGHDPKMGCPNCVRGLVCNKCNGFIGYVRDDPMAFMRGFALLTDPPAQKVLNPDG